MRFHISDERGLAASILNIQTTRKWKMIQKKLKNLLFWTVITDVKEELQIMLSATVTRTRKCIFPRISPHGLSVYRGEAVPLQDLWEALLEAGQAARSHADSLRRAPHQVPRGGVRVRVRRPERAQEAHEEAHRGEAVQVSSKHLCSSSAYERNLDAYRIEGSWNWDDFCVPRIEFDR